jgi:2-polyprenyl-3-methyl-5-hydroxy-6-metoxy-1,4-benzoquinol methylase
MFREFPFAVDSLDYEEYWNRVSQGNRPVSLFKLKLMASIIDEGSSVLDIGCGDGNLLQYLGRERKIVGHGIALRKICAIPY